jgi:hypothetical protein
MRIFARVLRRPAGTTTKVVVRGPEPRYYEGRETLEVVGESNYQPALWAIVGGFRRDYVRHPVGALLEPEPTNPYDRNAIKVMVDQHLVGYLSRHDAALYGPGVVQLMAESSASVGLYGVVVGGGERGDGIGFLGVFLDHDPTHFGVTRQRAADIAGVRTGFSEAVATDLADDSYDLSWYRELTGDPIADVGRLRAWLQDDPDPLDRHYMMNELRSRSASPTRPHSTAPDTRSTRSARTALAPMLSALRSLRTKYLEIGHSRPDGACGARTRDLRLAKPALSQLS